ncbi:MAG: type I-E CRISPR-associated protein Cas7/Cse4/CasC, partial [Dehalococcoidia bacterium]|nr:type I-E CRISPR-associated protein Cas7/Cse4/CasC [Dehalococcoidia bacterium]
LPALVFAVVREAGPWSLANAFLQPVRPDGDANLEQVSASRLAEYWGQLSGMYGSDDVRKRLVATYLDGEHLGGLAQDRVDNIGKLVEGVVEALQ